MLVFLYLNLEKRIVRTDEVFSQDLLPIICKYLFFQDINRLCLVNKHINKIIFNLHHLNFGIPNYTEYTFYYVCYTYLDVTRNKKNSILSKFAKLNSISIYSRSCIMTISTIDNKTSISISDHVDLPVFSRLIEAWDKYFVFTDNIKRIMNFDNVVSLSLFDCPKIKDISCFKNLKSLTIVNCPMLKYRPQLML